MVKEYGVQVSWNKLVSIPTLGLTRGLICPAYVTYTESKRECKFLFSRYTGCANLLWCDSEQEAFTEFDIDIAPLSFFNFGVFVESLVSITKTRRSIEE